MNDWWNGVGQFRMIRGRGGDLLIRTDVECEKLLIQLPYKAAGAARQF
jgi:hypothetical protein